MEEEEDEDKRRRDLYLVSNTSLIWLQNALIITFSRPYDARPNNQNLTIFFTNENTTRKQNIIQILSLTLP